MLRLAAAARSLTSPGRTADDLRSLAQQAASILTDIHRSSTGDDHLTPAERDELINERFGPNANDDEDEEDDDDEGIDADDDDNIIGNGDAVASIFRAHIVDNTRRGYQREQKKLAVLIFKQVSNQSQRSTERDRFRRMLNQDLYTALSTESGRPDPMWDKIALTFIQRSSESYHPINLGLLTASDFVAYLLSLSPDGEFKSKSTYGGARAGLFDLFRVCKIKQSDVFKDDLKLAYLRHYFIPNLFFWRR
jgi:hypothetical protein